MKTRVVKGKLTSYQVPIFRTCIKADCIVDECKHRGVHAKRPECEKQCAESGEACFSLARAAASMSVNFNP